MIYEQFAFWGRAAPGMPAAVAAGSRLTYAQALRWVDNVASHLRAGGVRPGHRVAVPLSPEIPALLCQFALDRLGACSCFDATGEQPWVDWFVTTHAPSSPRQVRVPFDSLPAADDPRAGAESQIAPHRWQPHESCRIKGSSGSTGMPKWIHRSYMSTLHGLETSRNMMALGPGVTCAHSLGTAGPAATLKTNAWRTGSTLALLSAKPRELVAELASLHVNLLALSPGSAQIILSSVGNTPPSLPDLQTVYLFGARAAPQLADQLCAMARVVMTYGSTETGNTSCAVLRAGKAPGHTQVQVRPESRVEVCASDEDGRGPVRIAVVDPACDGYVGDDGVARPFTEGEPQWFYTGDRGWFDRLGMLHITGRHDDVLNLGGIKLTAAELDDLVAGCGLTVEHASLNAMDAHGAETATAVVVMKEGHTAQQLRSALKKARPTITALRILVAQQLPRLPTTKLDYVKLRENLARGVRKPD
ncbi:MAG: acyl--CoA ligase [Burkholderiales bacterium]|nr:acyl--CoA ligase [Burkholderiales bacterium]